MPRSHRTTSSFPHVEEVLGGEQPLLDRGRHPALEQDRLARRAGLAQQLEVLHVARADLEHVALLGDALDVLRRDDLGDDRETGAPALLGEEREAREPRPWKLYGEVRGLKRRPPAGQSRRRRAPDRRSRSSVRHFPPRRGRDDDELVPPAENRLDILPDADAGVLLAEGAAREPLRSRHLQDTGDIREILQHVGQFRRSGTLGDDHRRIPEDC